MKTNRSIIFVHLLTLVNSNLYNKGYTGSYEDQFFCQMYRTIFTILFSILNLFIHLSHDRVSCRCVNIYFHTHKNYSVLTFVTHWVSFTPTKAYPKKTSNYEQWPKHKQQPDCPYRLPSALPGSGVASIGVVSVDDSVGVGYRWFTWSCTSVIPEQIQFIVLTVFPKSTHEVLLPRWPQLFHAHHRQATVSSSLSRDHSHTNRT